MKVSNITPYIPRDHGPGRSASEPQSSGFQKALSDALQPSGPTKTAAPGGIQTGPIPITSADAVEPLDGTVGINDMERFIDALEGYRLQLADPRNSLRDIAPALERLESVHLHLSRLASEKTVAEPLNAIMNEGLVTAATEIQRFRAGMYC